MRPHRKTALEAASGLATVLCFLQAGEACAQADPFALAPATATTNGTGAAQAGTPGHDADYVMFAEINVNGEHLTRLVKMRTIGGKLQIAADSAVYAGLIDKPPLAAYITLEDLPGISFEFDWQHYQLDLRKRRHGDGPNNINLRPEADAITGQRARPVTALVIDYDFSLGRSRQGTSAGGLTSARVVRGNVAIHSAWQVQSDPGAGNPQFVRLDTALTIRSPRSLARATLGDFVTTTPASARAVRMGGIQIGTDFSLRPDLVTYPLPDFAGSVAVPSGLDLVINDLRFAQAPVEPGEFTVRNIPVPTGRGQIGVVLRDALGREQVQVIDYYSSPGLLAPGLVQASVSLGAIRRRYGRASDDYGQLAFSTMIRRGFNRRVTGEFAFEANSRFANAGIAGSTVVGSLGLITVSARGSRFDQTIGPTRRGSFLGVSIESAGRPFSFRLEAQRISDGYDDLASTQGDEPPKSLLAANVGFDLRNRGSVNLSAIQQTRQRGPWTGENQRTNTIVTASYRNRIGPGINLFVDLSHRSAAGQHPVTSALFGLSVQLRGRTNFQSSMVLQPSGNQYEAALYSPDSRAGEWGYSVQTGAGQIERAAGSVSYRGDWGRIEGQAEVIGGETAARIGARGSLIFADGSLFAVPNSSSAFVIADADGVAGIQVLRENRAAGTTGRTGKRLVTDVVPNVPIRIGINPAVLPVDVNATRLDNWVEVPAGAVAKLDLGVSHYVALQLELRGMDGQAFPPGTIVRALPTQTEYLVGFGGVVELNKAKGDRELRVDLPDGRVCHAEIMAAVRPEPSSPAILKCYGTSRVLPIAVMLGNRTKGTNDNDESNAGGGDQSD